MKTSKTVIYIYNIYIYIIYIYIYILYIYIYIIRELKKLWNIKEMVVPMIIGAIETDSKDLKRNQRNYDNICI